MLITSTNCLCVVCVCPGEGIVAFNATPNPFLLNKICLNQNFTKQPVDKSRQTNFCNLCVQLKS